MNTSSASPSGAPGWAGPLMMAAGAVAIGFAPIGMRLSEFEPQATAFWRFAFALPFIAAMIWSNGGRIGRPSGVALLAGLFFGLDMTFWHAALALTSVANATFLVNLGNAAVGLIAWAVLGERPARAWFLALGLALFGALLLSRGASDTGASALSGDLLATLAAVMVAFYLFFAKLARRRMAALQVLFWSTATTMLVSATAAGLQKEALLPPDLSWFIWPLMLAIFAHVLGQGLIIAGVGRTPAALGGLLLLIQPVAAGLAAWPLFGESLSVIQLAGSGLVLAGVWLASRSPRSPGSPGSPG